MTSQNNSENNPVTPKSGKWSLKKRVAVFGTASLLAFGAFASVAHSGGGFFEHERGHGYGHKMGGFMNNSHNPANFEKHLDKKMQFMAFALDTSDEQQEKLKTIITDLMKEAHPMKMKLRETREELRTLLTQPKIDREAIEKLRVEKIALVDTLSKKATNAIINAGEILNLEQRVKLGEFLNKFGHNRRGWRRG